MKKTLYILLLTIGTLQAQYTLIPDASFESELVWDGYDDVVDGRVLTANIENIEFLDLTNSFIHDLTGIEGFQALKTLGADYNPFTTIDLSQNTNLENLHLDYCDLITLDLTGNPNLEFVTCKFSDIVSIDVSQCFSLIELNCNENEITSVVDVSNSPNLITLNIDGNEIETIDVTHNLVLESLRIGGNPISSIDLFNNTNLVLFNCTNSEMSSVDLSNNINLEVLDIKANSFNSNGGFTEIDVSNNIHLKELTCFDNNLIALDLSNNLELEELRCQENSLEYLDLNANTEMTEVDAQLNNLIIVKINNGNNQNMESMILDLNDETLVCVEVDDANAVTNNLPPYNGAAWHIGNGNAVWSNDCGPLNTEDYIVENQISIYPNPIKKTFTIVNNSDTKISTIEIYNQLGKQILKETNKTNFIDISNFDTGVYFLRINTLNNNIITKQLIKV